MTFMETGKMQRLDITRALFVLFILGLCFITGCEEKEVKEPPLPEVTVAKPLVKDVVVYAYYTGRLQAVASVDLRARIKGFLLKNNFKDGEYIEKGRLLFEIDPAQFKANVLSAQGKLNRAIAVEKDAKFNYRRTKEAHAKNVATDNELMNALAKRDSSIANVESARAALEQAKINLSYTKVHSPIKGQVSRHYVDVGNLVGASENTLLGTVIQNDPIYVYFDISGNDVLMYTRTIAAHEARQRRREKDEMTPVNVRLADGDKFGFTGKIDYANIKINTDTQTLEVRGILPNKDHLMIPGMFADVQIPIEQKKDAILVPDSAIGNAQGGPYVLALDSKNVVSQRTIKTGQLHGFYRVVTDGLKKEDRLVTNGIQFARVGYPVKPKEVTMKYEEMPKGTYEPGKGITYKKDKAATSKPTTKKSDAPKAAKKVTTTKKTDK